MAEYISRKKSWIRLVLTFFPTGGIAALLCVFVAGPRLGPLYDFLLLRRPAPPVSGELLIIDTASPGESVQDNILEPSAAASALLTMIELDAGSLIIQVPILGLSTGASVGEEEILYRFDEEFGLLSRNIRNLFDAIRVGSVVPSEAARYVGELVELSERGKERLVSALVHRDEEGPARLEKLASVFGRLRRPGDLLVQLIRAGGDARAPAAGRQDALAYSGDYSKIRPDRDGVLRRIAPILAVPGSNSEHVVYGALKNRYRSSIIEYTESGLVLANRGDAAGADAIIPLDKNRAVLFEIPHDGENFKRLRFGEFLEYEEADKSLRRLLGEAEALGVYDGLPGESNPVFLYDHALSLRDELIDIPAGADKNRWIDARKQFFNSLDDFLYGPAEMILIGGYEEIIAQESLSEEGAARLTDLRDSLILMFSQLRDTYHKVLDQRRNLESLLAGSFCIMGPLSSRPGDTEASALLANSLLTAQAVKPGRELYLFLGALACALVTCFCIKKRGPAMSLFLGLFLSLLSGAGFSVAFIFTGCWLDPVVPAAAAGSGTLISFFCALRIRRRFSRLFRDAYGPFVSPSCLRRLIRSGKPLPSHTLTARAIIVAVRNPLLMTREDRENSLAGARAVLAFQNQAVQVFKKAGAVISGCEGDLVLASFGSPLDGAAVLSHSAARAADCLSVLLKTPECSAWRFGMDAGVCAFTWSPLSGYSAFGRPVVRARIISGLGSRYKTRVIVTASASEALPDIIARRLDMLKEKDGSAGEAFYELRIL